MQQKKIATQSYLPDQALLQTTKSELLQNKIQFFGNIMENEKKNGSHQHNLLSPQ